MAPLEFRPIRVDTNSADEDGYLVINEGKLIAVLVRLSNEHEDPELHGKLFLEAHFGRLHGLRNPYFFGLDEAGFRIGRALAT